ncbi:serine/threonine protein kinase [Nanoarchaeota archaeon]
MTDDYIEAMRKSADDHHPDDTSTEETLGFDRNSDDFYKSLFGRTFSSNGEKVTIDDYVGEGAMGIVLKGRWNDKEVAVKILDPNLARKKDLRDRFLHEATTQVDLPKHPNILEGYFGGEDEKTKLDFLVMEYIPNTINLNRPEPFPLDFAFEVIKEAGKALAVAHRKLKAHRDVKPDNILVKEDSSVVKLGDFGLGKGLDDLTKTSPEEMVGTPHFMSPEQLRGKANNSSDIYALGATFYKLITGRHPFDAANIFALMEQIKGEDPKPPSKRNYFIQPEVDDFILRAMAKDWRQRHFNAGEFVDDLRLLNNQKVLKRWVNQYEREHKLISGEGQQFIQDLESNDYSFSFFDFPIKARRIVDWCWEREGEELGSRINSILVNIKKQKLERVDIELKEAWISDLERALQINRRTEENVQERITWLETLKSLYLDLSAENPDLHLRELSMRNKLAYEIDQRNILIPSEAPRVGYWQKYKWYAYIGVPLLVALAAVALLGKTHLDKRKVRLDLESKIVSVESNILMEMQDGDLTEDKEYEAIKKIINGEFRSVCAKRGDSFENKPTGLLERLEEEREKDFYQEARVWVDEAKKDIDNSDKEKDLEKKIALLTQATQKNKAAEGNLRYLKGDRAREIEIDVRRNEEMIGPKESHYTMFGNIQGEYKQLEEQISSLRNASEKDELTFAQVETLALKINTARSNLSMVGNSFVSGIDPTSNLPIYISSYADLTRNLGSLRDSVVSIGQELSSEVLDDAKTDYVDKIAEVVAWLTEGKNYLDESAVKKSASIETWKKEFEELLRGLNNAFLSSYDKKRKKRLGEDLEKKLEEGKEIREQLIHVEDLRKRAAEGNAEAAVSLIELYNTNELYAMGESLYDRVKDKRLISKYLVNSALRAFDEGNHGKAKEWFGQVSDSVLRVKHKVDVYLEIIRVDEEIKKPIITSDGYDATMLAELKKTIDSYIETREGEEEVIRDLHEVEGKTSFGKGKDGEKKNLVDTLGEKREAEVLGREGAKEGIDDYLRSVYDSVAKELGVNPKLIQERERLYKIVGRTPPGSDK